MKPTFLSLLAAVLLSVLVAPAVAAAAGDWPWPVAGQVLTPYRNVADPYAGGQHRGIDIAAADGEVVSSSTPGTVTFAGVAGSSGLTVGVLTADGRHEVSYLHLASAAVRAGQLVRPGERLGTVGRSGRRSVDAPHLHLGVREAGTDHAYLDPLAFLSETPVVAAPPAPVPAPVAPAPVPAATGDRAPRRPSPAPRRTPAEAQASPDAASSAPSARPVASPVRDAAPGGEATPRGAGAPNTQRTGARPASPSAPSSSREPARYGVRSSRAPLPSGGGRKVRARLGSGPGTRPRPAGAPTQEEAVAPAERPSVPAPAPSEGAGPALGWWATCLGVVLLAVLGLTWRLGRGRTARSVEGRSGRDDVAGGPTGPDEPLGSGAAAGGRPGLPRTRSAAVGRTGASAHATAVGRGRRTSIDAACPTTSRRRSTTSTPSLTSAMRTRRSRPTSWPGTCDSEERTSSS